MPIIKSLILIILPFFSWFYLKKNQDAAEIDEFKVRFGTLFQNLNPTKESFYKFTSYFCARRFLVALATGHYLYI